MKTQRRWPLRRDLPGTELPESILHALQNRLRIVATSWADYWKSPDAPEVTTRVPSSAVGLPDSRKADVLIQLLVSFRSNIIAWDERAVKTGTWSIGILLSVVGFLVLRGVELSATKRGVLAMGVVLFGCATQLLLVQCRRSHVATGRALARVEAALRLCDAGEYLRSERFFGYSGKWIAPKHITLLQVLHGIVVVFVVTTLLVLEFR